MRACTLPQTSAHFSPAAAKRCEGKVRPSLEPAKAVTLHLSQQKRSCLNAVRELIRAVRVLALVTTSALALLVEGALASLVEPDDRARRVVLEQAANKWRIFTERCQEAEAHSELGPCCCSPVQKMLAGRVARRSGVALRACGVAVREATAGAVCMVISDAECLRPRSAQALPARELCRVLAFSAAGLSELMTDLLHSPRIPPSKTSSQTHHTHQAVSKL